MIAALALALAAAAGPNLPEAHPEAARAEASKREVKLGEPFTLAIEIRHRPEESYLLPEQPALAPFRAAGPGGCRRADHGPREVITTCTLPLALFELGEHEVPALALRVQTKDGPAVLTVGGPPISGVGIIDAAAPAQELKLRDPAPPVPLLVRSLRALWWALGILAVAVAAVLLARWVIARLRAPRAEAPPIPPAERFARRLDALEAERLPERGRGEEHLARLSEIVREYLGALTGLNVLDLTTAEALEALRQSGDPRVGLAALEGFLAEADLVKFARAQVGPGTCAAGVAYARGLLEATRPPPDAAEARA